MKVYKDLKGIPINYCIDPNTANGSFYLTKAQALWKFKIYAYL